MRVNIGSYDKVGVVRRFKVTLEGAIFKHIGSPNWVKISDTEAIVNGRKCLRAIDGANVRLLTSDGREVVLSKWNCPPCKFLGSL